MAVAVSPARSWQAATAISRPVMPIPVANPARAAPAAAAVTFIPAPMVKICVRTGGGASRSRTVNSAVVSGPNTAPASANSTS